MLFLNFCINQILFNSFYELFIPYQQYNNEWNVVKKISLIICAL